MNPEGVARHEVRFFYSPPTKEQHMEWFAEQAARLAAEGQHPPCLVGHDTHDYHLVDIELRGKTSIPDFPAFPDSYATSFTIGAWDWQKYENAGNYCPGDDAFARAMDESATWENFDTLLTLQILHEGEGAMIDFGANAGWYTLVAAANGHDVLAVEADAEQARLLRASVAANDLAGAVTVAESWVGLETPPIAAEGAPRIRLMKADVEGEEDKCVYACRELFAAGLIDYAMIEVTPAFKDHYPDTIRMVEEWGYRTFVVPTKGYRLDKFEANPLGCTRQNLVRNPDSLMRVHQVTVLFEKR